MSKAKRLTNFIKDIYPGQDIIPLHAPVFTGNEKKYLNDCIDSTFVSSVGEYVVRFEEELARFTGAEAAVLVVNGTEGLTLALKLSGVKQGKEVITQPLSFVATSNAIVHAGGFPIFIDIDKSTLGLSPTSLAEFLEKNSRQEGGCCINKISGNEIVACIPMHAFGHPVEIEQIVEICDEYGISLIEDAAESLGSYYMNKHTGTFGEIGVVSFNGNKIITSGGGGVLLFKDKEKAKHARHLTTQAKIPHPYEFDHDFAGYNLRMPNINAALGLAQLEMIETYLDSKRALAQKYHSFCRKEGLQFFNEPSGTRSNYWLNTIICENKKQRDEILEYTNANGVMTRPAWKLLSTLSFNKNYQSSDLKQAIFMADRIINLPSSVKI